MGATPIWKWRNGRKLWNKNEGLDPHVLGHDGLLVFPRTFGETLLMVIMSRSSMRFAAGSGTHSDTFIAMIRDA